MIKRLLSVFLVTVLLIHVSLFFMPRPAHAQFGGVVFDPSNWIQNTITATVAPITSFATNSVWIKEYVLDPIAWVVSQTVVQSISGSVISFVTGRGNGSGKPQFVQNLLGHLRDVGDAQLNSFLTQFRANSNSPFASSIANTLFDKYLKDTSLIGFFDENLCTLDEFSNDVDAFLGGDWSQGGVAAWFGLTTRDENNPFTLYERASSVLGELVNQSKGARSQELSWGQGFISWCSSGGGVGGGTAQTCTDANGKSGSIQTPGSLIKATLDQSVGSGLSKIISADELDEIIAQLVANLISNVLGGASGGLAAASQSSSGGRPYIDQYITSNPGAGGVSGGSSTLVQSTINDVNAYEAALNAIIGAATTARTNLNALANSCPAEAANAQNILTSFVNPTISQAQARFATAETTRALANKVQAESNPTTPAEVAQYQADLQALASAPPSASDVATAQANALATGAATSTPPGSLNVSAGSPLDQLNLLAQNAQALQASCPLGTQ